MGVWKLPEFLALQTRITSYSLTIMSRGRKRLFAISAFLLVAAVIFKRVGLSDRASMIVGLIELATAAAIGISFGLSRREDAGQE
jgi:hypothetical protein